MARSRGALARLSDSLLFVLVLVTAATARPTIDFVTRRSSLEPTQRIPGAPNSRGLPHDAHTRPSATEAEALHERMMPGVTPMLQTIKMKQLHFKQLGIAILSTSSDFTEAIRETTRKLENFYMDIAYKAQDEWPQQPQVQSFDVNQGEVRLSFYCKGDTIPWAFVKNIAERLWESAALGLADLFEVIYSDDTGTVSVMIVLDVINRSSDGSTSGSGLREGSVPSITSPKD